MRHLVIASAYYPPFAPGGAEYSLVEMCKRLGSLGWRISIVTPSYDGRPRREGGTGGEVVFFPSPLHGRPGQEFDASEYLRSGRFESDMTAVLVETARPFGGRTTLLLANNSQCFVAVAQAGRRAGVRTAGIVRDSQSICETGACLENCRAVSAEPCRGVRGAVRCMLRFARDRQGPLGRASAGIAWHGLRNGVHRERFRRKGLDALDALVAISQALALLVRKARGPAKPSPSVISNFRADIAPAAPAAVDAYLAAAGLKRGAFFLMAGKKSHGKGADVAAAALALAQASRPEARILFVGKGSLPPGAGSGAVDRPPVSQEMVLGLLQASAALLIPGRWQEGLHRTLIEALFFGVPVVCTEAGAPPESVRDGVNGYVTACNDPAGLAQAMVNVLAWDAQRRGAAAVAAARIFAEGFADAVLLERWRQFLEATLTAGAQALTGDVVPGVVDAQEAG